MMGVLIDQWGTRNVGLALLAVAGLLLVSAALIAWEALARGLGILALDRAQTAALVGDRQATVAHARESAAWLPDEPAAALLAIDLSDPAGKDALARLELRIPVMLRPPVAAIAALHQFHHGGRPANALTGGDQAVIAHLFALERGGPLPALSLPDSDPPQAPLLAYAAQARLRAAWAGGQRDAIRQAAGELRLAMPGHPDRLACEAVLLALSPDVADADVITALNRVTRGALRDLILLRLVALAPERAAALTPLLPATGAVR